MNIVRLIMSSLPLAFGYCCLATVMVQAGGGVLLWSTGKLTKEKVTRYTAIACGLDITKLPLEEPPPGESENSELTRDQQLDRRVNAAAIFADRTLAMKQEADAIRSLEKELKSERDRRAKVRKNFLTYLDDLEKEVVVASLGDVQRTLESISPRQAKDILLNTLEDQGLDEGDDVLGDVVTIVKAMPENTLKRISGELKTPQEVTMLHTILMEITGLNQEESP